MQWNYETEYDSRNVPGYSYTIRRISLARRMRFLAQNHDLIQELRFLSATPDPTHQEKTEIAQLELELSQHLLEECLLKFGETPNLDPVDESRIEWLLTEAPSGLCVEILAHISEEISLSELRRKN
jgi:hypothetical protein